ncbi:hypothetical protein XENOCAPTIV_016974 [Xenoophorus captivus]|uniref:Uncharacterized protein n=1 Tax=Xenoophorus captivus TaxID=1517983 RepID=A0ABV0R0S4_9TELE
MMSPALPGGGGGVEKLVKDERLLLLMGNPFTLLVLLQNSRRNINEPVGLAFLKPPQLGKSHIWFICKQQCILDHLATYIGLNVRIKLSWFWGTKETFRCC